MVNLASQAGTYDINIDNGVLVNVIITVSRM